MSGVSPRLDNVALSPVANQNDNDNNTTVVFTNTDSSTGNTHGTSVDAVIQVNVSAPSSDNVDAITCSDSNVFVNNGVVVPLVNKNITTIHHVEEVLQVGTQNNNTAHTMLSKITELTLDRFKNNYRLFVPKLADELIKGIPW